MSPAASRQRLLSLIDTLPRSLPILAAAQAARQHAALESIEHLAIELRLQAQRYRLLHSLRPELSATAVVECCFGPFPAGDAAALHRRLLELNWLSAARQPFGLSIDTDHGEVLLASPLHLPQASAADFAALLSSTVQLATAWRATGFLDVPMHSPAPPAAVPGPDPTAVVRG